MAVNKNFVVKNGIEVNSNLILADANSNRVGIGSTGPRTTLDVRGGIAATDGNFSGILTAANCDVANYGVLNGTGSNVSGFSTFGGVSADQLNVTGISTFTDIVLDEVIARNLTVTGISTIPVIVGLTSFTDSMTVAGISTILSLDTTDTNVSGVATIATLEVTGDSTFAGHIDVDGQTDLDELVVTGVSTFSANIDANGGITASTVKIEDLTNNRVVIAGVGGELTDSNDLTFNAGTLALIGNQTVSGNLDVDGHTELDDLSVSGVSTFAGQINADGNIAGDLTGDVTGNLTGDVTGNVTGDLTGNVTGNLTGDVTGNVTGDLTGDVTGNVTGNLTGDVEGDVTGDVTGNVTGNLTGNVTGNLTGNVTGNVEGDVTGDVTGNLTGEISGSAVNTFAHGAHVTGILTATSFVGDGANITGISTLNILDYGFGGGGGGGLAAVVNDTTPQLGGDLDLNGNNITGTGNIPSGNLSGALPAISGASLTNLSGSSITSGTVASARIGSLPASKITTGTFDAARIPDLGAGKITSGTFDAARIPTLNQDTTGTSALAQGLSGSPSISVDHLDVAGITTATNIIEIRSDDSSAARLDFFCEVNNAHYTRLQSAAHANYTGNVTVTLPVSTGTLLLENGSGANLTNLDAGSISSGTINADRIPTLNQDTSGNAATATKLATARDIGGVPFDGTQDINLPGVNTAGDQDTSGNASSATALANARLISGESFDGTADITLNNTNITNGAGYITSSGNAATASELATARNIGGVSFNGSQDIDLPGVNTAGDQDTSGTAANANNINVTSTTDNTTFPVLVGSNTDGNQAPLYDTQLAYDASLNSLSPGRMVLTNAGTTTSSQLYFNGTTSNRLAFNSNGINSPTFTQEDGTGRSIGTKIALYQMYGAAVVDYAIGIESSAMWYSVATTSNSFKWYGGQTSLMELTGTGLTVYGDIDTSVVNSSSDINLKKDIEVISNANDILEQISGVSFNWKESNKPSVGVIAQEVEKVLPELISENSSTGTKSVNYNGLIGVLIEAVKDLSQRVKELEADKS